MHIALVESALIKWRDLLATSCTSVDRPLPTREVALRILLSLKKELVPEAFGGSWTSLTKKVNKTTDISEEEYVTYSTQEPNAMRRKLLLSSGCLRYDAFAIISFYLYIDSNIYIYIIR